MTHKSQERQDWENSTIYAVLKYRNTPQQTEDSLDDFLYWIEYETEIGSEHLRDLRSLVDQFLGRSEKVHDGEIELLKRWTESVK